MNNNWYIKWFNSQEPRKTCPDCGEPTVATENAEGEVVIDLKHKPDCKLYAEWTKFVEATPNVSPGERHLMWCHRDEIMRKMYPKDSKQVADCAKYRLLLRSMAEKMNVLDVYDELIAQYPQFEYWSGSHNHLLHHYGRGGLVRHTWEIIDVGMQIIPTLNLCDKLNPVPFFLASLFHDTGKMFDYELKEDDTTTWGDPAPEYWKPTEHRRLIHHLPRSALIFHDIIGKFPELHDKYHDDILHAILAHHGRRDDGSPVAPKTRLAWLVHLCDSISARMDDAERIDVVKKPTINI